MNTTQRRLAQTLASALFLLGAHPAHALNATLATYGGGPIVNPDIVPVFWGTKDSFTQAQIDSTMAYLNTLAQFMSGNGSPQGQEPTIMQYGVRAARIEPYVRDTQMPPPGHWAGNGMSGCNGPPTDPYSGPCVDFGPDPKDPNGYNIAQEITRLGLSYGPERVIVMITNGIGVPDMGSGHCAYHSSTFTQGHYNQGQYYAEVPFDNPTCGNGFSGNLSHEILESATDAFGNGWTTAGGNEIADSCGAQNVTIGSNTIFVSAVSDDLASTSDHSVCSVFTTKQESPISAVSQTVNFFGLNVVASDLFAWGSNKNVTHLTGDSVNGWSSTWVDLGGPTEARPVAVAGAAASVDLFIIGTDNNYYHKASADRTTWPQGWEFLGGPFSGPPAAVSCTSNRIDVFGLGTDGNYYTKAWTGSWPGSWTWFRDRPVRSTVLPPRYAREVPHTSRAAAPMETTTTAHGRRAVATGPAHFLGMPSSASRASRLTSF